MFIGGMTGFILDNTIPGIYDMTKHQIFFWLIISYKGDKPFKFHRKFAWNNVYISHIVYMKLYFFYPNIGTLEERGIRKWRETTVTSGGGGESNSSVYDLPFIQKYLNRLTVTQYLPFCANFRPFCRARKYLYQPPASSVDPLQESEKNMHVVDTRM